jgi:hypothetical protein
VCWFLLRPYNLHDRDTYEELSKVIKPVIPTRVHSVNRLMLAIEIRMFRKHRATASLLAFAALQSTPKLLSRTSPSS